PRPPAQHPAPSVAGPAATAARPATKSSAAHLPAARSSVGLRLLAKAEGLAQPQVERKARRTLAAIDRNLALTRGRPAIEPDAAANCAQRLGVGKGSLELSVGGAIGKDRVVVRVGPAGHIEWSAGAGYQERAETKHMRQANTAAKKQAMADVECAASEVHRQIILIGGKTGHTGGVGVGIVQCVVAEQ